MILQVKFLPITIVSNIPSSHYLEFIKGDLELSESIAELIACNCVTNRLTNHALEFNFGNVYNMKSLKFKIN